MKGRMTQLYVKYDHSNFQLFKVGMEVEVNAVKAYVIAMRLVHQDSAKTGIVYTFEEIED